MCIDTARFPRETCLRMALVKGSCWPAGVTLRVHFMSGDRALHDRVAAAANEWTTYANIQFAFGAPDDAEIRIDFVRDGSWSVIGTDAKQVPRGRATMNFGWLTAASTDVEVRRVVLHEFGHALGCIHEHQNPGGQIHWNKPAVYAYYAKPPNGWDAAKVDHNIFETYQEDLTSHTTVDPQSIMMYPIPSAFTTDGYSVGMNTDLSATDKAFIRQMYQ